MCYLRQIRKMGFAFSLVFLMVFMSLAAAQNIQAEEYESRCLIVNPENAESSIFLLEIYDMGNGRYLLYPAGMESSLIRGEAMVTEEKIFINFESLDNVDGGDGERGLAQTTWYMVLGAQTMSGTYRTRTLTTMEGEPAPASSMTFGTASLINCPTW